MPYEDIEDYEDGTWDLGCRICKKLMIPHVSVNDPRNVDPDNGGFCDECYAILQYADDIMHKYYSYGQEHGWSNLHVGIYNIRDKVKEHLFRLKKGEYTRLWSLTLSDLKTLGVNIEEMEDKVKSWEKK